MADPKKPHLDEKPVPNPHTEEEIVDESSEDSFPASDPPSWTGGTEEAPKKD